MIIRRTYITNYLENHITDKQRSLLNTVPGLRIRYIVTLSVIAKFNNIEWLDYVPVKCKDEISRPFAMVWDFEKLSVGIRMKYANILNEEIFNFIQSNDSTDMFKEEYLEKIVKSLLKVTKFKLDDFE